MKTRSLTLCSLLVALLLAISPLSSLHAQDMPPVGIQTEAVAPDGAAVPPNAPETVTPTDPDSTDNHVAAFKEKWTAVWTYVTDKWSQLGKWTKGLLVAIGIWPLLLLFWVPLWTFLSLTFTTIASYLGLAYLIKVMANSSIYGALRGWFEAWASKRSDRHSRELPQRDLKFPPTAKNFSRMRLEESERSSAFVALLAEMDPKAQPELAPLFGTFATTLDARSKVLSRINTAFDTFEAEQAEVLRTFEGAKARYGFLKRFFLTYAFNRRQKKVERAFNKETKVAVQEYHTLEEGLVVLHDKLHARLKALSVATEAQKFLEKTAPPPPPPAEAETATAE